MTRRALLAVAVFALLVIAPRVRAVNFFWTGPALGGPGGNFRAASNWTYTPPPFPLDPAPGGASDTANFDFGRSPENRYTVTDVNGSNNQLLIHDDSLRLDINSYELLSTDADNHSFIVGVASGDEADVILRGVNNATLRTKDVILGLAVASSGEVTVDHLQWDIDGELNVGGYTMFVGGTGGDGSLTIQNGSLVVSDHFAIGRTVGSIGDATITASTLTVNGSVSVGGQGIGSLLIEDGSTVSSSSATILQNSTAIVDGTGSGWHVEGVVRMFQHPNSTLIIQNGGEVKAGDGVFAIRGNSSSEIRLDSDGVLDAAGEIEMNTGDFNFLGGTLHVDLFDGHLVNQGGALAPGHPDAPAGSTYITGNYTHQLAATLQIEIGGETAGAQHDFVNVEGTASIAGALELALLDDIVPAPDDEFVVFNTDSLWLGSFSNVVDGGRLATVDGGGSFLVHYGPTSTFNANQVVLTDFVPGLPGDYNHDGTVDAADYVTWRKTDGTPSGYNIWFTHFGQSNNAGAGNNASVPEPATVYVALVLTTLVKFNSRTSRFRDQLIEV